MKSIRLVIIMLMLSYSGICQKTFELNKSKIMRNESLDYFLKEIKTKKFTEIQSKKEIPTFIKQQLPWINDSSIADKGEPFQATDVIMDNLPRRRMRYACSNRNVFVIGYEKGGVGTNDKIMFVKYSNKTVTDVWIGTMFCKELHSLPQVIDCINRHRTKRGLNTNFVDY